jgi:hypothetical protein
MERVSGRHRRSLRLGIVTASACAAVLVVTAGSWAGYQQLADKGCTGRLGLNVAAAPELEPAIRVAAQRWMTRDKAEVDGTCVVVNLSAVSAPTMAAAVAQRHKATLLGLGSAPASMPMPDVWIADSSTWLLRLSSEASGFVPADGGSVAQSPVVLAMPEPAAQTLGWPKKTPAWKDLVAPIATSEALRPGIADPTRDAAGLAGVLALGAAAGNDAAGAKKKVGVLRALAVNNSSLREDLLQKFPQSAQDAGGAVSAAPLSEEDVVTYNAGQPPVKLAALYPEPAPAALDYPFAVMPEVEPAQARAAAGLHEALRGADYLDALGAAGLRASDGRTGAGFVLPANGPAVVPPVGAKAAGGKAAGSAYSVAINQVLGSWAAITLPGRELAVFDVSGSMLTKVPSAGGLTRAEVTQRAAAAGLALLDDKWAVGNWTFSTNMVGKRPWKENVPITPLSSGREKLTAAISEIVPRKNGDTGLYDTALAAYRTVRDSWQSGRVNSVVLFTDGKNDNDQGITRAQLVAGLTKLRDPKRPVRVVIIGIGNEVDRAELKTIADASGDGGVFIAEDPSTMGEIFLQAIATRTGA